jgi:hypothetical protein
MCPISSCGRSGKPQRPPGNANEAKILFPVSRIISMYLH